MSRVIVLNASYEPLQTVSLEHAARMLVREVAVIEEADEARSFGPFPFPKVLRLVKYVYVKIKNAGHPRYSRNGVLRRDNYTCAYCGKHGDTIDHIIATSKGGKTSWLNCITSCQKCNARKRDKTLKEANMKLLFEPYAPTFFQLN